MNLPKRGFAAHADGTVYWAWEDNVPVGPLRSLPPLVTNMDGTSTFTSRSDDTVIDLDDCGSLPNDMGDLHKYLLTTRLRKLPSGRYVMTVVMEDGTEIDHPALSILNFRRKQRGLAELQGAPKKG